ncbi:hypothetical protein PENSPDRAFT_649167 [Peniophora sp. CONT]|nr:hypothetical protein PENSPDRAFT_649167 [Peniophora sp. CONT]
MTITTITVANTHPPANTIMCHTSVPTMRPTAPITAHALLTNNMRLAASCAPLIASHIATPAKSVPSTPPTTLTASMPVNDAVPVSAVDASNMQIVPTNIIWKVIG